MMCRNWAFILVSRSVCGFLFSCFVLPVVCCENSHHNPSSDNTLAIGSGCPRSVHNPWPINNKQGNLSNDHLALAGRFDNGLGAILPSLTSLSRLNAYCDYMSPCQTGTEHHNCISSQRMMLKLLITRSISHSVSYSVGDRTSFEIATLHEKKILAQTNKVKFPAIREALIISACARRSTKDMEKPSSPVARSRRISRTCLVL